MKTRRALRRPNVGLATAANRSEAANCWIQITIDLLHCPPRFASVLCHCFLKHGWSPGLVSASLCQVQSRAADPISHTARRSCKRPTHSAPHRVLRRRWWSAQHPFNVSTLSTSPHCAQRQAPASLAVTAHEPLNVSTSSTGVPPYPLIVSTLSSSSRPSRDVQRHLGPATACPLCSYATGSMRTKKRSFYSCSPRTNAIRNPTRRAKTGVERQR